MTSYLTNESEDSGTLCVEIEEDDSVELSGYGHEMKLQLPVFSHEAREIIDSLLPIGYEKLSPHLMAAAPDLLHACKAFVKHIESLPDDTEKCRHLRLSLKNRPGELLIEALAKAEKKEGE